MSLLETRAVGRRFGSQQAVQGVDLKVEPGEVVGLLGANGAGKTTLIRMALGLLRPSNGEVSLFDRPPSRATRFRLGYLPQGLGLYDDLTVAENLSFAARAFGRRYAPEALDPDLRSVEGILVRSLPLGLRRRLAFAAALSHDPELLVLDEPTSGVEPLARARLWETIRSAAERGVGVLVTTHHMSEAPECDRLVMMVAGRVAAAGSAEQIIDGMHTVSVSVPRWEEAFAALEGSRMPVVLVGRTLRVPDRTPAEVEVALRAAGVEGRLSVVPSTFDEAFVTIASRFVA
jgi:ABC-2 type transport system ATP-binding protein